MGLFRRLKGDSYVIVCYFNGRRVYLDHVNYATNEAHFTTDETEVGFSPTYEDAERIVEALKTVRGVSRIKIYDSSDDRWL